MQKPKNLVLFKGTATVYEIELNSAQKVRKLFLLEFLGKCVEFCQLNFISFKSPCVYLSKDISFITIGHIWVKIWHCKYGWVTNQMCQNETFSVLTIPANSTPQQVQKLLSSRLYFKDSVLILSSSESWGVQL